jgi:hypothetical protein
MRGRQQRHVITIYHDPGVSHTLCLMGIGQRDVDGVGAVIVDTAAPCC